MAQMAFPYRSSKRGEPVLLQAASLAASLDMHLAVVVPFVPPADGPGCCGIRGRAWVEMLRQVAREDAQQARHVLRRTGVAHSVTVSEGSSIPEIVDAFASADDRQLALPNRPSGTAFSRSTLRDLRRRAPNTVRQLSVAPA